MRRRPLMTFATLLAFLLTLHVSRPAAADTLTGVVGELGVSLSGNRIQFRFTDPSLTASCKASNMPPGYLGLSLVQNSSFEAVKALYALLLASKKGATIACVVDGIPNCYLQSCVLL